MKLYKFIIIGAIIVIGLGVLVGIVKSKEIIGTPNTVKGNLVNEENLDGDKESNEGEELDFSSRKVQELYFFTGAFPTNEVAYLSKLKNVKREDLTNEQILRLGFAKVTKEDWADSYVGEGQPLEIHENILEEYIEDIFGEIDYKHEDFSNKDISLDGAITSLYTNEYDETMNKYIINPVAGDGVGDSYTVDYQTKAIKYEGEKIEIIIKPLYIKNLGQIEGPNGDYEFEHQCYKSYDFETGEFSGELTGIIRGSLYDTVEIDGDYTTDFVEEIKNINEEDLETYIITYKYSDGDYIFDSIKYEN